MSLLSGSLIVALFLGCLINVQASEYKGVGRIDYRGGLDKKERRLAEKKAVELALKGWIYDVHPAHSKNFQKIEDDLYENIDQYVLSHVILDTEKDKSIKRYTVAVRAKLNEPLILEALLEPSDGYADGELISYVFVAREIIGRTSRSEESTTQSKAEKKVIGKDIDENTALKFKEQKRKAGIAKESNEFRDAPIWDVSTAEEVNATMGNVFTNANYLVVNAGLLEEESNYLLSVNRMVEDYRYGADLQPQTLSDAKKGMKNLDDPIRYFAIGTLNVDEQYVNKTTGLINVPVVVSGRVLDIKRHGAEVAIVRPITEIGEGPTFITARNNALLKAGEKAAKEIVAQLSAKNIR